MRVFKVVPILIVLWLVGPVFSAGSPAFFIGKARTGEKPQSKVWFHQGFWWCLLPGTEDGETALRFYQLLDNTWQVVGGVVDEREDVQVDVWAEGDDLYVLVFQGEETRFLAFSFVQNQGEYFLHDGFPVSLSPLPVQGVETMSLRRDSAGRFWAAFEGEKPGAKRGGIYAIWSDDGHNWHQGGVYLAGNVDLDDIATLCRFQMEGHGYLGVIWSQQSANPSTHRDSAGVGRLLMRAHKDGDAPGDWSQVETIAEGRALADDHLNTAVAADGSVYLVTKTSLDDLRPKDDSSALLMLHVRNPRGQWRSFPVSQSKDRGTRPIVVLDEERGILHVFFTRPTNAKQSVREIVHQWTERSNIHFSEPEVAIGMPNVYLNDATSTHQGVTISSGLLVMCWGRNSVEKTPNRAYYKLFKLDGG